MSDEDHAYRALRLEDYAMIGDCSTGAMVGRNGSIDWLCWPRFDDGACFAALLGTGMHGRWLLAPIAASTSTRRYRGDTLILETLFQTEEGDVSIVDFMPVGETHSSVVRKVEGRRGRVAMRSRCVLRFEYGSAQPGLRMSEAGLATAIVGPNLVVMRSTIALAEDERSIVAQFEIGEGENVEFVLTWEASHRPMPPAFDLAQALVATERYWLEWSECCTYKGEWQQPVIRSLLTLKALTYQPTGGMVAALTTSLPEQLGGPRNWDYRYCWLRDSTLTLMALLSSGHVDEASAWFDWAERAIAGRPEDLQIMYGLSGERLLSEHTLPWLPGYENSSPVNIGNAASTQFQLDVYGEVICTVHLARRSGLPERPEGWAVQVDVMRYLGEIWTRPDDGIWEVRGGQRHFTHSKIMAWVAVDRSIADAESHGLEAPLDAWRQLRKRIHEDVCKHGFDARRNAFTQSYGHPALDASLLLIPQTGFLAIDDPRVAGTIAAIEEELLVDGLVLRYSTDEGIDGLPPGEGTFLACSFWLVEVYVLQGRFDEARALFGRLLVLANDVGLLSEEYDTKAVRLVGNMPQAFSHLALVSAALAIERGRLLQKA